MPSVPDYEEAQRRYREYVRKKTLEIESLVQENLQLKLRVAYLKSSVMDMREQAAVICEAPHFKIVVRTEMVKRAKLIRALEP